MHLLLSLVIVTHILLCQSETTQDTQQPNIVFLLADDLGWNDIGYHGSSDILTPNIDSLQETGLDFSNHYVQPQCTPSRAALLTGRYPIRYGLHHDSIAPSDTFGLSLTETLLPQELQRGGYETFMVGKWHLGFFAWEYTPTFRGFDKFYGFYNGAVEYITHTRAWDDVEGYDLRDGTTAVYNDDYATYYQRDKMIEYIETRDTSKPFFLYGSFQAVHSPNQIPTDDVWKSYKSLTSRARKIHATKATIMDQAIGSVIDTLKGEEGLWENTIVIFTSDNGAIYNAGSNYPLRGSKSTVWEGGVKVPMIVNGGYLKDEMRGTETDVLFHIVDWLPTFLDVAGVEATRSSDEMDGISQLSVINGETTTSLREGFLIHTDPLDCQHVCGAYRYGKWKLIRDPRKTIKNEKTKEGCFWTDDFQKEGSTATMQCALSERVDTTDLECGCGTDTCLFDLENDPCEEIDLSEEYPVITQQIYAMLAAYNESDPDTGKNQIEMPQSELFPPDTDGADPSLHNGFWTPWMYPDRTIRDNDDASDVMVPNVGVNIDDDTSSSESDSGSDSSTTNNSSVLRWMLIVVVSLIVVLLFSMFRINFCSGAKSNEKFTEIAPLLQSDHYIRQRQ